MALKLLYSFGNNLEGSCLASKLCEKCMHEITYSETSLEKSLFFWNEIKLRIFNIVSIVNDRLLGTKYMKVLCAGIRVLFVAHFTLLHHIPKKSQTTL